MININLIILVIILLIILLVIIYFKSKIKEAFYLCTEQNCGILDVSGCLECEHCGVMTDNKKNNHCVNGNKDGPMFIRNWIKWKYLKYKDKYNINSPSDKLYDEYDKYFEALDKIYKDTPQPKF